MKIIMISIGTRGDMEPFLAIGEFLVEKGHRVICAFPEQFKDLVDESHLGFASLGTKYIDMLDSADGKAAMGGHKSGLGQFLANIRLAKSQTEANKELVQKQFEIVSGENPDRIVYNSLASYPILWGLKNRGKNILVCALPYLHYVRGHSHVAFHSNFGPFFNRLTYSLADFGIITTTMITKKWLNINHKINRKQIKSALESNKAIYTISPALFSRPDYWKKQLKVLGYQARKKTIKWQPDKDLMVFLAKHNRILFITFGSMLNPEPEAKTKIILDILECNNIPAILNTASGGLVKPDQYDLERFHFVSQIPYDWIFPKMYAVIHHGGSGTTHLALKYGCATMIIPHVIDQFVWNEIVHRLCAGPKGIKIGAMTKENLEPRILELVNHPAFKKNAENIAGQIAKENFRDEIYQTIVEE